MWLLVITADNSVVFPYLADCLQDTFIMDDMISHWNIECGKPLTDIHSSPFCSKTLLASYCEFLQNLEVHFPTIA